jgi:hypothetical protein
MPASASGSAAEAAPKLPDADAEAGPPTGDDTGKTADAIAPRWRQAAGIVVHPSEGIAMSIDTTPRIGRRELAHRTSHDIDVSLLWNPADDAVAVRVRSLETGRVSEIAVRPDHALNAFNHPFVYAALEELRAETQPLAAA